MDCGRQNSPRPLQQKIEGLLFFNCGPEAYGYVALNGPRSWLLPAAVLAAHPASGVLRMIHHASSALRSGLPLPPTSYLLPPRGHRPDSGAAWPVALCFVTPGGVRSDGYSPGRVSPRQVRVVGLRQTGSSPKRVVFPGLMPKTGLGTGVLRRRYKAPSVTPRRSRAPWRAPLRASSGVLASPPALRRRSTGRQRSDRPRPCIAVPRGTAEACRDATPTHACALALPCSVRRWVRHFERRNTSVSRTHSTASPVVKRETPESPHFPASLLNVPPSNIPYLVPDLQLFRWTRRR
jgi:hypothetical protein